MSAWGEVDGWFDAAMGLPCQAANRFATFHVLRSDADWRAYVEAYVESYLKTTREQR